MRIAFQSWTADKLAEIVKRLGAGEEPEVIAESLKMHYAPHDGTLKFWDAALAEPLLT